MANGDSPEVMEYRLQQLENMVSDVSESLAGIKDSLHTLVETKDAMSRAFTSITNLNERVSVIEKMLPILNLTSGWVRAGVVCLAGIVMVAVIKLIIL